MGGKYGGQLTFLQKLISLRTSMRATSCGVVTITADTLVPSLLRHWAIVMCSSLYIMCGGTKRGGGNYGEFW